MSIGSKGDAYDAVAESLFATIKKELVHRQSWPSGRNLGSAVFEYVEADGGMRTVERMYQRSGTVGAFTMIGGLGL